MSHSSIKMFVFTVNKLKNRPELYIGERCFFKISSFIEGYSLREFELSSFDFTSLFQEWLRKKERKHFSFHWSHYVYNVLAKKDNNRAIDILFDMLGQFIDSTSFSTAPQTERPTKATKSGTETTMSVEEWLLKEHQATPDEFMKLLHDIYQEPDMKARFPNVNLLEK